MLGRLTKLMVTVALACSIGLHWPLLQSVAWTTMLARNLSQTSLSDAVQLTFDGQHPCALCKAIAAGKKSEKKPELLPVNKKVEFCYSAARFIFAAPATYWEVGWPAGAMTSLDRTPPVPPPKQLPG
jgi:hypothetical protein